MLLFLVIFFTFHFREHLATILNVTIGSGSLDNGSGMDRLCIGFEPVISIFVFFKSVRSV